MSAIVAVSAAAALAGALSFATEAGIHWIVSTLVCGTVVAGALLLLPHVRRGLRHLAA